MNGLARRIPDLSRAVRKEPLDNFSEKTPIFFALVNLLALRQRSERPGHRFQDPHLRGPCSGIIFHLFSRGSHGFWGYPNPSPCLHFSLLERDLYSPILQRMIRYDAKAAASPEQKRDVGQRHLQVL